MSGTQTVHYPRHARLQQRKMTVPGKVIPIAARSMIRNNGRSQKRMTALNMNRRGKTHSPDSHKLFWWAVKTKWFDMFAAPLCGSGGESAYTTCAQSVIRSSSCSFELEPHPPASAVLESFVHSSLGLKAFAILGDRLLPPTPLLWASTTMLSPAPVVRNAPRFLRQHTHPSKLCRRSLAAPASGGFQYKSGESSGVKFASRDLPGPTTTLTVVSKAGTRYQTLPGYSDALEKFAFKVPTTLKASGLYLPLFTTVNTQTISIAHHKGSRTSWR